MRPMRLLALFLLAAALGDKGIPLALADEATTYQPSAQYAGRIAAAVKRNLVYTEALAVNKAAEVEITLAVDGSIVDRRLLRSSGVPSWDEAALQAVDRTKRLPLDSSGRVPPVITIAFHHSSFN